MSEAPAVPGYTAPDTMGPDRVTYPPQLVEVLAQLDRHLQVLTIHPEGFNRFSNHRLAVAGGLALGAAAFPEQTLINNIKARSLFVDNPTGYRFYSSRLGRTIYPGSVGVYPCVPALERFQFVIDGGSDAVGGTLSIIGTELVLPQSVALAGGTGSGALGPFPAAVALSDLLTNPTTTEVGADTLLWDAVAAVWVRAQNARGTAGQGNGLGGVGLAAAALWAQNPAGLFDALQTMGSANDGLGVLLAAQPASAPQGVVSGPGAAVTLTIPLVATKRLRVTMLSAGYNAAPPAGSTLTLSDGTFTLVFDLPVTAGTTSIPLPPGGIRGAAGAAITAALSLGGGAVVGHVNAASLVA